MTLFSEISYENIKQDLSDIFLDDLEEVIESYQNNKKILSKFSLVFEDNLGLLKSFTGFNYYWLDRFLKFLEIYDITHFHKAETPEDIELHSEAIIDYWTSGEFQKSFLDEGPDENILKLSEKYLKLEEKQLINMFKVHALNQQAPSDYLPIYELGDLKSSKAQVQVVEGFNFHKMCKKDDQQVQRLEWAIKMLKEKHSEGYKRLQAFTTDIISTDEAGVVSYSMQQLPGHSILNLYDRDDVDLLDDLLHENGHHHLNYYLNQEGLIYEDDEKIFYSPWRQALRPIRGIYHAVNTFFYALDLFSVLCNDIEGFTNEQQDKIRYRFCEEYLMLNYCIQDLHFAFYDDKITERGNDLINEIIDSITDREAQYEDVYYLLNQNNKQQVDELKNTLKDMRVKTTELQERHER